MLVELGKEEMARHVYPGTVTCNEAYGNSSL